MRIRREKRERDTGWERVYFPNLYTNIRISERHCKDMEIRQHRAVGREGVSELGMEGGRGGGESKREGRRVNDVIV